jgi:hypothetical protein
VSKPEKGCRSTVSPISPRPVFEFWIFSHLLPFQGGGRRGMGVFDGSIIL